MMKIKICVLGILYASSMHTVPFLLDKVEAIVFGPKESTVITYTDSTLKRTMDGRIQPLDALVDQAMIVQQAKEEKMPIGMDVIDNYLDNIKKQNNLSLEDVRSIFSSLFRTYQEGIDSLYNNYVESFFKAHKFTNRIAVTEEMISAHYFAHPEYEDSWFEIKAAYVDYVDEKSPEDQKAELEMALQNPAMHDAFDWSDVFRIHSADIAQDKQFIMDVPVGDIYIVAGLDHLELYKMVNMQERRLKTLDECKASIIDKITKEYFDVHAQKYQEAVKENYLVLHP
jgi:hypothetical protein